MNHHPIRRLGLALLASAAFTCQARTEAAAPAGAVSSPPPASPAVAEAVLALPDLDTRYEMDGGRPLAVTSQGNTLRVRYGRRPAATLQHDGQGRFVSHDGRLTLQFQLDRHGAPSLVHLTLPADWL